MALPVDEEHRLLVVMHGLDEDMQRRRQPQRRVRDPFYGPRDRLLVSPDLVVAHQVEDVALGTHVIVDRPLREPRGASDLPDRGAVVALPREYRERRADEPSPPLVDELAVLDVRRYGPMHTERSVSVRDNVADLRRLSRRRGFQRRSPRVSRFGHRRLQATARRSAALTRS